MDYYKILFVSFGFIAASYNLVVATYFYKNKDIGSFVFMCCLGATCLMLALSYFY